MINLESKINKLFRNKTLLITGGTGSFGKIVLKNFAKNLKKLLYLAETKKNKRI